MKKILSAVAVSLAIVTGVAEAQLPRTPSLVAENVGSGSFVATLSNQYTVPSDAIYRVGVFFETALGGSGNYCWEIGYTGNNGPGTFTGAVRFAPTVQRETATLVFKALSGTNITFRNLPECPFKGTWFMAIMVERL
jgi:hypothetical protein